MFINYFLGFLGGLAVFLLGVKMLCENCSCLVSGRVEKTLNKHSASTIKCFGSGIVISAITQSSVATNASVISLVNSNKMSLKGACAVILGVNIGTTITTQIISLSGTSFSVLPIACFVGFVGVIFSFFKGKFKNLGYLFLGFGFIFIGLDIIATKMSYFTTLPFFKSIFKTQNPLLLVLYGILVPAITFSSSSLTGVMVVLASQNLISFNQCVYLILGANVGSCIGVFYSLSGKSDLAKTTATFNLLVNVFGLLLFFPINMFASGTLTKLFDTWGASPQRQFANFHTVYNLISSLIVLPLLDKFIYLSQKLNQYLQLSHHQ
jgi:phosphate:Na+ symporter